MIVQVKDALSGIGAVIDHYSVAAFRDTEILCQFLSGDKNCPDHRTIGGLKARDRRDVFARHDEKMNRRFGTDVLEGHHRVILVNDVSFNLAFDDGAEETIARL